MGRDEDAREGTERRPYDAAGAADTPSAEQERLPLDLSDDQPIPFALTARARRAVAPASLPKLTVLDAPEPGADVDDGDGGATGDRDAAGQPALEEAVDDDLDDPHDTRPSRARALRRAGVSFDDIAAELEVDTLVVRAWVDDVAPVHSARRRLRPVAAGGPGHPGRTTDEGRRRQREDAYERTRRDAHAAARDRVRQDASFTAGLGLLVGVAETSPHAIVVTTRDREVAGAALRWLSATVDLADDRVRVILRIAPQAAADRVVHEWSDALEVDRERIRTTRWRHAPDEDTVEAMVRVADPRVAGAVAGWRDALLASLDPNARDDLDLAF